MMLADIADVREVLGRGLTDEEHARALHLLKQLSALFCLEADQTFTVESYRHRVKVDNGVIQLPKRPVVDVLSVEDDLGNAVTYRVSTGRITVKARSHEFVVVSYTAGYAEVPDVVRLQIAGAVKRLMNVDPAAVEGVKQQSVTSGPFSMSNTFANWAVGGQAVLSQEDLQLARRYRAVRYGHVWVATP